MKRLIISSLFLCGSVCAAQAQQNFPSAIPSSSNVAADFTATSAATIPLIKSPKAAESLYSSADFAPPSLEAEDGTVTTALALPMPARDAAAAEPAAPIHLPRFSDRAREDYRWQLALGFSLERFRSSIYTATAVGTNTSLTYFHNDWLGVEGNVSTFFAPTIWGGEHIKLVNYGIGPKASWLQSRWEPFIHVIVGGIHALPQTASGGKNGFALQAGGGADIRLYPRFSIRGEVDYVPTHLFGAWQHNVEMFISAVLHF
ncbi:MAG: hypothetical protein M3N22_04220 [Acidobacteriota bacterium]|nr:hypothetical protein [Acidobacteriota bacterium]